MVSKPTSWSEIPLADQKGLDWSSRKAGPAMSTLDFRASKTARTLSGMCLAMLSIILLYLSLARINAFDRAVGRYPYAGSVSMLVDSQLSLFPLLDEGSPEYLTTFLSSVVPIPCHSENDDQRQKPLNAALKTGCISIGTKVWASPRAELLVGEPQEHSDVDRTLQSTYLEPLASILRFSNPEAVTPPKGLFLSTPTRSLTLLFDFKSPSEDIFPALLTAIRPLIRNDWVTYWDNITQKRVERPLTIVVSGLADFETVLRGGDNSPNAPTDVTRHVFYDAPLDDLVRPGEPDATPPPDPAVRASTFLYNRSNSQLASASYASVLRADDSKFRSQRMVFLGQIRAARCRGLLSRYWDTPNRESGLQKTTWDTLAMEGVTLLGTEDLDEVKKAFWRSRAGM